MRWSLELIELLDPINEDIEAIIREETGIGVDIIVDAVGVLLPQASALIKKGGDIVLFGLNANAREPVKSDASGN